MAIQITNFPSKKNFDALFTQGCADVRDHFREAWDVASRAATYIKKMATPSRSKGKGAKRNGRISIEPIIIEIMHETGAKPSAVYDARKCGATFDEAAVEEILAQCKESGFVPSRQLFLELMRVAEKDRVAFAEEIIRDRCSADEIALRRHERFGKKGKGTKRPRAPQSQFEAKEQISRYKDRLSFLFSLLLPASARGKRRTSKLEFATPADIEPAVRSVMKGLTALEKKFEEAVDADSAA